METVLSLASVIDDVDDLCTIDYELFPENNFNERTLSKQLTAGAGWVVRVSGHLAGYCLCSPTKGGLIDILRLGVREPARRTGVATQLLQTVIGLGHDVMLSVRKGNVPAINLYHKHGFRITGSMPQHYSWVMRLKKTSS